MIFPALSSDIPHQYTSDYTSTQFLYIRNTSILQAFRPYPPPSRTEVVILEVLRKRRIGGWAGRDRHKKPPGEGLHRRGVEPRTGLEPVTYALRMRRSTN